jgi:hypothetical protein
MGRWKTRQWIPRSDVALVPCGGCRAKIPEGAPWFYNSSRVAILVVLCADCYRVRIAEPELKRHEPEFGR